MNDVPGAKEARAGQASPSPGARGKGATATTGVDGAGPIAFFDGECGLCANVVRWIVRRDRRKVFRFAPLQGSTWRTLGIGEPEDLSTLVVRDERGVHRAGDAVIAVLRRLGPGWRAMAAIGRLVPRGWRDALYRAVASRRRRGAQADACGLAGPGERSRFLP